MVILGRDGLLIDTRTSGDLDGEHLAALTPAVVSAAEDIRRRPPARISS